MNHESNYIDELFAENFKGFEAMPPRDVWSGINKRLTYKLRIRQFSYISGIAASIALFIGVYSTVQNSSTKNTVSNQLTFSTASTPSQPIVSAVEPSVKKASITIEKKSTQIVPIKESTQIANNNTTEKFIEPNIANTVFSDKKDSTQLTNNQPIEANATLAQITDTVKTTLENKNLAENTSNKKLLTLEEVLNENSKLEQPSEISNLNTNRWSVECQLAPMYAYRDIQNSPDNISKSDYNKNETGLVTYTGGLKVSYQTSRRLSIQVGIYYSSMGQTITNTYNQSNANNTTIVAVAEEEPTKILTNNSMGVVTSNLETHSAKPIEIQVNESKIIQKFNYVELPLLARYKIIDDKIGFNFIGGFSTNWLVKNTATLVQDGVDKGNATTPNIRNFNYSSTFGIGVNYNIIKQLNLSIEPTCKYYLSSLSTNNQIKVYPYSLGVYSGLVYTF